MCEWVSVEMIRQYVYCPRKIYFRHVLGLSGARTPQVKRGLKIHSRVWYSPHPLRGRNLIDRVYRAFDIASEDLCIRGQIDLLLRLKNGKFLPVEIKTGFSIVPDEQHVVQLEAYLTLLNSVGYPADRGILYYKDKRKRFEIVYTSNIRDKIVGIANDIRSIIRSHRKPARVSNLKKCRPCEYRKFCD